MKRGGLRILDTTLRDGDQSPLGGFTGEEKLAIARALSDAGVDVIEAGFPASGKTDFDACALVARASRDFQGNPAIALMARAKKEDIDLAARALAGHPRGIIHLTLPVSDRHIAAKLSLDREGLLALARESTARARETGYSVEFGAEDATRADPEFLAAFAHVVTESGAETVNVADTLGITLPREIAGLVAFLIDRVPAFREGKATVSVHCHNDSGLALANTLAAIEAGAGQAEVTVLGLGERAGNAALEELAAIMSTHPKRYPRENPLDREALTRVARLVASFAGTDLSPLKPVTGWNVRAHASGIHQQGLSRDEATYRSVYGPTSKDRIVLTRHSGRAGVIAYLSRYLAPGPDGNPDAATIDRILDAIKGDSPPAGLTEILALAQVPGLLLPESFTFSGGEAGYEAQARFPGNHAIWAEGPTRETALVALARSASGEPVTLHSVSLTGFGAPSGNTMTLRIHAEIAIEGRPDTFCEIDRSGTDLPRLIFIALLDCINAARSAGTARATTARA